MRGGAPDVVNAVDILLTFARDLPRGTMVPCFIGGIDAGGRVGPYSQVMFTIVENVRTSDLQVSVSWDVESDLDLIVLEPTSDPENPFQIDFATPGASPNGGQLDLDSNPGCFIDGIKNENISWPPGREPSGLYAVFVNLFDGCNTQDTNYVVTIQFPDGFIETFTGSLNADEVGQPVQIDTFTLE